MAFGKPTWTPPVKLRDQPPGTVQPATRTGSYAGTTGEPVPKEAVTARPGKRAPTAEERAWMDWIVAHGCIACWIDGNGHRAPAVHHILRGGQRIGHLHTLPLCQPGHHMDGQSLGMVSRHPFKARFEQQYGTEQELLAHLQAEYQNKAADSSGRCLAAMKSGAK